MKKEDVHLCISEVAKKSTASESLKKVRFKSFSKAVPNIGIFGNIGSFFWVRFWVFLHLGMVVFDSILTFKSEFR